MSEGVGQAGSGRVERVRWTWRTTVALAGLCLWYSSVLWYFHDRFWYPTDDGFYAHIAERILSGEVLHRDVQDIHPVYIHVLHAMTFRGLGVDMVHLRYPLMVCAVLQVVFTFALLARRGVLMALVGGATAGSLGVLQFFNPNPNWYCQMLAIALIWWLVARPAGSRHRLIVAGVIVGVMTCLRHLTGVWAAMGLLTLVLMEMDDNSRGRDVLLGRSVAATMLVGLIGYLALTRGMGHGGFLMMAATPIALLVMLMMSLRAGTRAVAATIAELAGGFLLASLPLLAYYLWNGVLVQAAEDLVLRAWGETRLPFFEPLGWYLLLPLMGIVQLMTPSSLTEVANGIYWLALPTASALNGVLVLRHLRGGGEVWQVIPGVVAAFFAMVSVLLEGPFYLYYSVSVSVVAVLWQAGRGSRAVRYGAIVVVGLIGSVALTCHAGQPLDRSGFEMLRGQKVHATEREPLLGMRASFLVPRQQAAEYNRLVALIRAHVEPWESMLVLPNDAQLYFIAERKNASRFYNSALGVQSESELRALLQSIVERPPRMVVYRRGDKYEASELTHVMQVVRDRYKLLAVDAGRELYVLR